MNKKLRYRLLGVVSLLALLAPVSFVGASSVDLAQSFEIVEPFDERNRTPQFGGSNTVPRNTIISDYSELQKGFQKYADVIVRSIAVPTVVELPLVGEPFERSQVGVYNQTEKKMEPNLYTQKLEVDKVSFIANPSNRFGKLADLDLKTSVNFPVTNVVPTTSTINLAAEEPIESSAVRLFLDKNVALPSYIGITAKINGEDVIVVANKELSSTKVVFPKTTAQFWTITLTHSQPLVIAELEVVQDNASSNITQSIRWLAKPDESFRVLVDADRYLNIKTGESPNLFLEEDVLVLPAATFVANPFFAKSDIDNDGVPDESDNCVNSENADQEDINFNGRGDVCDDFDKDGILNSKDNCPTNTNRRQLDVDSDGIGDECDEEESRLTERHKWVPWAGIGIAAAVIITLFALTANSMRKKDDEVDENKNEESVPPIDLPKIKSG